MSIRPILRKIPGLAYIARTLDIMERDHLDLVAAHQSLERSYLELVDHYRSLEAHYHELDARFQRLTRPRLHSKQDDTEIADGLALPPPILRYWVAGNDDLEWFLKSGKQGRVAIENILATQQLSLSSFKHVLDFGCGCGRVLRHVVSLSHITFYGTDSNLAAIEWCQQRIPQVHFSVNALEPPLDYAQQTFDLIYAFSVFTHLTEDYQRLWLQDLHRCLKPGGYLILSTHGDYYVSLLNEYEQIMYHQGKIVLHYSEHFGENVCSAFLSEAALRQLVAPLFSVVSFLPQGAKGNPLQDLYLLQAL